MEISELGEYGIPKKLIDDLVALGFHQLTRIQEQAVRSGLFEGNNLLISAPTNSGKTFIAELAVINTILHKTRAKTFYLLPLKSLAEEKFIDFNNKYSEWGLDVAISTGDRTEFDSDLMSYDIIIATYEKLLILLIKNPELIHNLGVVIIDEIQNIGDQFRGVNLEILLSLLLTKGPRAQIIGLSATVPNSEALASWLDGSIVESHLREIDLREGIEYVGDSPIVFNDYRLERGDFLYKDFNTEKISLEEGLNSNSFSSIISLSEKEQTLIFCHSRPDSEKMARELAKHMKSRDVNTYLEQLGVISDPTPSSLRLIRSLRNGVAFHHAGLLAHEREIIENAFSHRDIQILCATTTLASGVNTPAKNVIFRSHAIGKKDLSVIYYKNMSGRAGRLFYHDDYGRSILFAKTAKDFESLWNRYITSEPEPVESQIPNYGEFSLPLLLIIQFFSCTNSEEILDAIRNTLFGHRIIESNSVVRESFEKMILTQIKKLVERRYLKQKEDGLLVSELGLCCVQDLISPQTADIFLDLLKRIQKSLVSYDELTETIIQMACFTFDARKSNSLLYLPRNLGPIREYAQEKESLFLFKDIERDEYLCTIATTRLMIDWLMGTPYNNLRKYGTPSGQIKRIAENLSWILRSLCNFARCSSFDFESGFHNYLQILSERIFYGAPHDSLNIIRLNIPGIQRTRASILSKAGYNSLERLLTVSIEELTEINGIDKRVALKIKEEVEKYLPNENEKRYRTQRRKLIELSLDPEIIRGLYESEGDEFVKSFLDICTNQFGITGIYVGDAKPHDVDGIIQTESGNIVIEGKRQDSDRVGPVNSEEVWGKGQKHDPIAFVTLGYPDFTTGSIENVYHTGITLVPHYVVADWIIEYYRGNLTTDEIIENLMSGEYLGERVITNLSVAE